MLEKSGGRGGASSLSKNKRVFHCWASEMELHIHRRCYLGVQEHFFFLLLLHVVAQVESLMASGDVGVAGFRSWL